MKLLYTLTAYPPYIGGAQLHQHLLAQQLNNKHPIQVVSHWNKNRTDWLLGTTINAPTENYEYTIDGINVHQLGLSAKEKLNLLPYIPIYYPLMDITLPKIASCLEKHLSSHASNADLIHNVRIGREGLSYASYYAAKKQDIPFIFTPVHHPRWVGWRYRAYIQLYKLADAVIVLTNSEKKILMELGVKEENIYVTGHGAIIAKQANPKVFKQKYHIEEPIILFLGQHYPYKGYQQLLQATALVWQKIPEANFVFIGPQVGKSKTYFKNFQDKRIHYLGKVDLQEKTNALAACDLLCVPSTQESFGGVYTEAWSFGKPVIGCDIPAVAEVVTHDKDGYLVEQKPEQIANTICELLLNQSKAKQMGLEGQKKVQSKYSWKILANKTEQVYKNIIS